MRFYVQVMPFRKTMLL